MMVLLSVAIVGDLVLLPALLAALLLSPVGKCIGPSNALQIAEA